MFNSMYLNQALPGAVEERHPIPGQTIFSFLRAVFKFPWDKGLCWGYSSVVEQLTADHRGAWFNSRCSLTFPSFHLPFAQIFPRMHVESSCRSCELALCTQYWFWAPECNPWELGKCRGCSLCENHSLSVWAFLCLKFTAGTRSTRISHFYHHLSHLTPCSFTRHSLSCTVSCQGKESSCRVAKLSLSQEMFLNFSGGGLSAGRIVQC